MKYKINYCYYYYTSSQQKPPGCACLQRRRRSCRAAVGPHLTSNVTCKTRHIALTEEAAKPNQLQLLCNVVVEYKIPFALGAKNDVILI